MYALTVSRLTKSFGKKALLNNISFTCKQGEAIGIFGRNGCGKSTLLKILFGTMSAESIIIALDDKHVPVKEVIPQGILAYLPQEPFLPKNLKVRDVVPLYFSSGKMQDKLLYNPPITKMANTRVGSLSMGEVRYLELMLVGHLSHPFLMLDEPFSMIEPRYKDLIKEFLAELKDSKGFLITDHYYEDVLSVADRSFILKDATLIEIAGSHELSLHGYLPSSAAL